MKTILIPVSAVSLAALALLTACSPAADPDASASASPEATTQESTEQTEAQPRLVVTYEAGVEILDFDGAASTSIATLPLDAHVSPNVGPDGRHVYLVDGEGSVTAILDSGSYAQGHGDHFHYYTREPAFRPDQVEGASPVHVVGHDGVVAISNDGDGTFDVFDEIGLTSGGLQVTTIETGTPHHGVAVPIHEGVLYTLLGEGDEGPLPDTIVQADAEGNTLATYEDVCPALHGEASMGHTVVFGCATGIAVIDTEAMASSFIAYPADAGELRVGSFYADADTIVGNWGSAGIVLVDIVAGTITPVLIDGVAAAAMRGDEGEIIVLTTDGNLHVLDESGAEVATVAAIDPFELPEGHGGMRPTVTFAEETVVISDPAGLRLVLVAAHDWAVSGEITLTEAPLAVVATGLAPAGAAEHDHDH